MQKDLKVSDWLEEITDGLEYRRKYGLEEAWAGLEEQFYNVSEPSSAGPNIVFSTGEALQSELTVPRPVVSVKPGQVMPPEQARMVESLDNMLLGELKVAEEAEKAVLHAFLFGVGVFKIGYDSEFGYDPTQAGVPELGLTLNQFDSKGRRIEFDKVRPGWPWVRAVLPHDIVVPYGVSSIENSPWVAHRVVRHIDDVKADPKYSGTRTLQPVMSMADFMKSYTSVVKPYRTGSWSGVGVGSASSGDNFVELWEIHDKRTGRVYVIATGHGKFLRNEVDLLQVDGELPFVDFSFVPRTRSFWVTPDAFFLRVHQAELTDISIQATKQRRLGVLKFLYSEDAFDETELEKATSSEVGAAAAVRGGISPRDSIVPLNSQYQNQSLMLEAEAVRRAARENVGFSRNQLGEYETIGRRTASEAMIVQRSSEQRMGRRHLALARAYKEVVKKLNSIVFTFWTSPRVVRIVGQDGLEKWVNFVGRDLKASYQYELGYSSEPIPGPNARAVQAIQVYSALRQDPTIDPIQLERYLVNQVNDPEFSQIFMGAKQNAQANPTVQGVQGVRGGGGGGAGVQVRSGGQGGGAE